MHVQYILFLAQETQKFYHGSITAKAIVSLEELLF